ncbi:C-type lectin lectoxin-Phi2-like [Branchiostoma floridae x Branchiostoma belcheri]
MKKDVSAKLVENEKSVDNVAASVTQLTKSGLEKEILQRLEMLEDNMKNNQDKPENERAPKRITATCPGGYKKYREVCYKYFGAKKTFSESAETCRAEGGTLAMPRDAGINDFLFSLLRGKSDHWIGLQRQEGKWVWMDGTALGTGYNQWGRGEPDYTGNQLCVGGYVSYTSNSFYNDNTSLKSIVWGDKDCDKRRRFFCQVLPSAAPGK